MCPGCQTLISADAVMCYACGYQLKEGGEEEAEIPCPACGTVISADAVMCYACGQPIGQEKEEKKGLKKILKRK